MEFDQKRRKGRTKTEVAGVKKGVEVEEGRREWDTGGLEKLRRFDFHTFKQMH